MLGTRILTAVILVPLVLAALFLLTPLGWGAVSLAVIGVAATEWADLAGYPRGPRILFVASTLLIGGLMLVPLATGGDGTWADVTVLAMCGASTFFWLAVAPVWLRYRWKSASPLGMALVGWIALIGAWVALGALQAHSPWLVLAAMAIVWIADTAAYFAGRAFGRHKLAPQVSPGKTWEGVYGAMAAVAIYAVALVPLAVAAGYSGAISPIAVAVWVALALVLVALSVEGDLFESLLKRNAGVKDSGRLLPGHGGILDRIDALLAAMPAAALLAYAYLR
ncbi:MAG: phosphatidate cytidylyltransferase [Betaproteobacteria bacterium]